MMETQLAADLLGAAAALLIGAATALFNHRLTMRTLRDAPDRVASVFALRQAINIAVLAAVFFLTPLTPADRTWTLVACAVGLTLLSLLLTARFAARTNAEPPGQPTENTQKTDHTETWDNRDSGARLH